MEHLPAKVLNSPLLEIITRRLVICTKHMLNPAFWKNAMAYATPQDAGDPLPPSLALFETWQPVYRMEILLLILIFVN